MWQEVDQVPEEFAIPASAAAGEREAPRCWWESEIEDFSRFLAGSTLARRSQATYVERVRAFLRWVDLNAPVRAEVLRTPQGRDAAVTDYLQHLTGRALAPSSLNVTRAALDCFYRWHDLDRVQAAAAAVTRPAPPTLTSSQRSRVLDVAAQSPARDNALVVLALATGLRQSELAALDLDDVTLHAETGTVRAPGADAESDRVIELDPATRRVLLTWLAARRAQLGPRRRPAAFFLGRTGARLSPRRIDEIVRDIGREAGLPMELSPGVLRNTFERDLVHQGAPAAQIRYLMGQRRPDRDKLRVYSATQPPHRPRRMPRSLVHTDQLRLL